MDMEETTIAEIKGRVIKNIQRSNNYCFSKYKKSFNFNANVRKQKY